jgi:adenylate kinase family enzyme
MRINVIGTSGSGKSTFSKILAKKMNVPYVEMDALHWKANWKESSDEELFNKLKNALSSEKWILDGNYSKTEHIKWKQIQIVIFLDLPFYLVLYRIIKRSLVRGLKRQELWAGNKESISKVLFSKDSMILFTIKNFYKNRKRYSKLSNNFQNSQIKFISLKSRKDINDFLLNF